MLKAIRLKNFKKHETFEFNPAAGLTAICGPNWSGKTTLLSAVAYGLFGLRAVSGTADDLTTTGLKECQVEVLFSSREGDLVVSRGPGKAELRPASGGRLLASGQAPVTQEIEHRLGISAKDFLAFHVISQDEAQSLLTLGETKLNEFVTRLTGLSVVDQALERLHTLQSEAAGALAVAKDRTEELALAEQEFSNLGLTVSRTAAESELREKWQKTVAATLYAAAQALESAESKVAGAERYAHESLKARTVLKVETDALEAAIAAGKLLQMNAVSDVALSRARSKALEARQQVASIQARMQERSELEKTIRTTANSLHQAEAELEKLPRPERTFSAQEMMDAQMRYLRAHEDLETATRALEGSMCLYCMRPFEDSDQDTLQTMLDSAKAEADAATEEAAAAERYQRSSQELDKARELVTKWEEYLAYLNSKVAEDWPDDRTLEVAGRALAEAEETLRSLEESHREEQRAAGEILQRRERVKRAQEALDKLGAPVAGVPSAKQLQEAKEEVQTLNEDYRTASKSVSELQARLAGLKELRDSVARQLATLREEQALYQQYFLKAASYRELTKFLRDNRGRFLASVWRQLMGYASQFIRQATRGDVTELKRSDEGKFSFVEQGQELSVAGSGSGMQRAIFSTALKLALSAALGSQFRVFLFDEITAAAEDEISLLMTSLLARSGDQILLVTHRQADAAAAELVIQL